MTTQDSVVLRAEKAAKILSVQASDIIKVLDNAGISSSDNGLEILNSPTTSIKDIADILIWVPLVASGVEVRYPLGKLIKELPAKTAANALKSCAVEVTPAESMLPQVSSGISALAQTLKPIQQWDDKTLLETFIATRSAETEEELDRRARHKKFVVLKDPSCMNVKKYEPGKEVIDVEITLKLLKDTRKRVVPGFIPANGGVAIVYRVTELNPEDRVRELCPICGELLFNGYCVSCALDFSTVGDDERAYANLVTKSDKFNVKSHSDRKALHASASKNLSDMRVTWPSISQEFDELKLTNGLPSLRKIKNVPAASPVQDPFHVSGNRAF